MSFGFIKNVKEQSDQHTSKTTASDIKKTETSISPFQRYILVLFIGFCFGFLAILLVEYWEELAWKALFVLAVCVLVADLAFLVCVANGARKKKESRAATTAMTATTAMVASAEERDQNSAIGHKVLAVEPPSEIASFQEQINTLAIDNQLTPREREILLLLVRGRDVRYISKSLVVSVNTVRTHVQNVYAKLGVHSRQELLDYVDEFTKGPSLYGEGHS